MTTTVYKHLTPAEADVYEDAVAAVFELRRKLRERQRVVRRLKDLARKRAEKT